MSNLLISVSALIGQGLAYSKIYLFHVCCLFSIPALWKGLKGQKLRNYQTIFPMFLLGFFVAISLLWSDQKSAGIKELLQFSMGLYLLFFNKTIGLKATKLENVIVWIVSLNLLICLGEALGLFRYPLSQYSEYASYFKRNFFDWYPQESDVPTGLHWNPNNNSFFILIFSPLVMTLLKPWKKILYYLICSFIFYKTGSKLLLIGWIFFTFLILIYFIRNSKVSLKKLALVVLSLTVVAAIYFRLSDNSFQNDRYSKIFSSLSSFLFIVPEIAYKRFTGQEVSFDYMAKDSSLHERLTMLDGILKVISENPLFGAGAGTLSSSYHQQGVSRMVLNTPHFYLLEIWAKYGVFAFVIYLLWLLYLLKSGWQKISIIWMCLLLFLIFSPVVSSLAYFLPKWVLYSYALTISES